MRQKILTPSCAVTLAALLALSLPASTVESGETGSESPLIDLLMSDGMTREELVSLYRSLSLGEAEPPDCVAGEEMFDDVPASHPFCPWIEELARNGITSGCDADNYCPGDPVSRAQMAAFIVRGIAAAQDRGEIVLAHSTANLLPNSNVTPSSVTNFSPHSTVSGDGYAQLDLVGPMFFGGEEYGLASITYCIRGLSGGAFIAGVELADRNEVVAFDTTNRTEEGCYEFEVNLPGDAFGFALQAAGGGSLRINGVESVWKPVSELPTGVQPPPPPPVGETSASTAP